MEKQALVLSRVYHVLLSIQSALHTHSGMVSENSAVGDMRPEVQLEACAENVLEDAQQLAASHKQHLVRAWITKLYRLSLLLSLWACPAAGFCNSFDDACLSIGKRRAAWLSVSR